jgi:hypothetical protein
LETEKPLKTSLNWKCNNVLTVNFQLRPQFTFFNPGGWAKTRVFQEKDMGDWVFEVFLLFLGFSGFFQGFWVFLNPCILGISKYVKV